MANKSHLQLVKQGASTLDEWREENPRGVLDLRGADLSGMDLSLGFADIYDNRWAFFVYADLREADLRGTSFRKQNLHSANLKGADLTNANLGCCYLYDVNLTQARLEATIFEEAELGGTILTDVNLLHTLGLENVRHRSPSTLSFETIRNLKGQIAPGVEKFLRGCGMLPWEIECARLYDEALSANTIAEILSTQVFSKRASNPISIGGIFISYAHVDSTFALKLYSELYNSGFSVWMDHHDMTAGNIERQVEKEIRLRDIVLIVLSENSIKSDWVEHELALARAKEKAEKRDVLCPVAIDNAWKSASRTVLWRQLEKKYVIDFSDWGHSFESSYAKLLKGLRTNYLDRA